MSRRRMTKKERDQAHNSGYNWLGEAKPVSPEELEKMKQKEMERKELLRKRLRREKKLGKGRAVESGTLDKAIEFVLPYIMEQNHEMGPFQCPYCKAKPFKTKDELHAHIKAKHPQTVKEHAELALIYLGILQERAAYDESRKRQMDFHRRLVIARRLRKRRKQL